MVEENENHLGRNFTLGSPKGTPMEESHSLRQIEISILAADVRIVLNPN